MAHSSTPRAAGASAWLRLAAVSPAASSAGIGDFRPSRMLAAFGLALSLLVAALIDLEYLQGFFREIQLHSGGVVSIFRDDGVHLIRWPHHEASTGRSLVTRNAIRLEVMPNAPGARFRLHFKAA